jgi:hypothetical protein
VTESVPATSPLHDRQSDAGEADGQPRGGVDRVAQLRSRLGSLTGSEAALFALLAWAPLSAALYPFLRVGDPATITFDRVWIAAIGVWTLFNLGTGAWRSRAANVVVGMAAVFVVSFGVRAALTPGDTSTVMKVWVDAIVLPAILLVAARRLITGIREWRLLMAALALTGLILALIGIAEYVFDFELATRSGGTPFFDDAIDRVRVSGPYPLTEIYALSLLACLAATLCWMRLRGKGLLSWPTALVLIELAAIVITYFRAAWIAAVIIIVCAVAYRFRTGLRPAAVVAIVAGLAVIGFGLSRIEPVTTRLENSDNVTGRIATWGQDLNVFATAPVFGVGVEDFTASTSESTDVVVSGVRALDQPHSSYLGLLAEQGVVGFLPLLLLTVAVAWMIRALRKRSMDDDVAAIRACLIGAGLAFLVMSLTLTLLPRGSSSALFALLIGGAAAQLDRFAARGPRPDDQGA